MRKYTKPTSSSKVKGIIQELSPVDSVDSQVVNGQLLGQSLPVAGVVVDPVVPCLENVENNPFVHSSNGFYGSWFAVAVEPVGGDGGQPIVVALRGERQRDPPEQGHVSTVSQKSPL